MFLNHIHHNRILPMVISKGSCSPLNSCYKQKLFCFQVVDMFPSCFQMTGITSELLLSTHIMLVHNNLYKKNNFGLHSTSYIWLHKHFILLYMETISPNKIPTISSRVSAYYYILKLINEVYSWSGCAHLVWVN